jgi:hypothetical protein
MIALAANYVSSLQALSSGLFKLGKPSETK